MIKSLNRPDPELFLRMINSDETAIFYSMDKNSLLENPREDDRGSNQSYQTSLLRKIFWPPISK